MQSRNRVFDDAARVAGGALGTLSGIRREVEEHAVEDEMTVDGALGLQAGLAPRMIERLLRAHLADDEPSR